MGEMTYTHSGIPYQMLLKINIRALGYIFKLMACLELQIVKKNVASWSELRFHIWENAMSTKNNWGIACQTCPIKLWWLSTHPPPLGRHILQWGDIQHITKHAQPSSLHGAPA